MSDIRRLRDAVVGLEPGDDRTPTAKLHRLAAELRTLGHPAATEAAKILAGVADLIGDAVLEPPTCFMCGRYVKTPGHPCKSCSVRARYGGRLVDNLAQARTAARTMLPALDSSDPDAKGEDE